MPNLTKFPIDSDIPMPTAGAGRPPKYPWRELAPGDSFFVAISNKPGAPSRKTLATLAAVASRRLGRKYVTRLVFERGRQGVRIWRQS
jgi:hypothetical protein